MARRGKDSTGERAQRADAARNTVAILDAAVECFSRHPDASLSEVAEAAGVGRVTLYAHFPSREALLTAAVDHVVVPVVHQLEAARLDDGPAPDALERMIREGWPSFARVWGLLAAASSQPPSWVHVHAGPFLAIAERLIARGQAEGSFRRDLPLGWLVAALHALMHAAGREVADGQLDEAVVAHALTESLLGILARRDPG